MQLPSSFVDSLKGIKGFDEGAFTAAHESARTVTSIRINPCKLTAAEIPFEIRGNVPWSSMGYYLESRPVFTLDPLLHAGAYYVQEASSMFLETAMRQLCNLQDKMTVLDLCAAPGGKSTLIQSLISPGSVLLSNEIHKSRVGILEENMVKWGGMNVVITNSSPEQFSRLPKLFDLIVVDAPCSGSGLFRKDPAAIKEWSLQNVELCARRQKEILELALPSLSDGGVLIYSTCSYSTEEDEDIAAWCSENGLYSCRLNLQPELDIVEVEARRGVFGYRFYPDKLDGEGFFLAAFRKTGEKNENSRNSFSNKKPALSTRQLSAIDNWVDASSGKLELWQDKVLLMNENMQHLLPVFQKALYIKYAGLRLGTMVREEMIPDHALAMSRNVSAKIPHINLNLEDALCYLRREEFQQQEKVAGWHLASYKGLSLGWIKGLGNRLNNYYPKEWKIRMKS